MKTSLKKIALSLTVALGGLASQAHAVTVSNISLLTAGGGYTGVSVLPAGDLAFGINPLFKDTAASTGPFVDSISFTLTASPGEYLGSLTLSQTGWNSSGVAVSAKTVATTTLLVDGISSSAGQVVSLKSNGSAGPFNGPFTLSGTNTPLFTFSPMTTSANITILTTLLATGLGTSPVREGVYVALTGAFIDVTTTPVPLPATALLLAPALLALARRRKPV